MPRKPAAAALRRPAATTTKKQLQKPIEEQDHLPTTQPASPVRPSRRTRTTRVPKPSSDIVMTTSSQSKPLIHDPTCTASDDATAPSSISNQSTSDSKHPISNTIPAFPASVKRRRLPRHRPAAAATLPNSGWSTAIAPTTLTPSAIPSVKSPSSCYSTTVSPQKSSPRKRPFPNKYPGPKKSHRDHASSSITHVNSEQKAMAKSDITDEERAMIMKIENITEDGHKEQNGNSKSKKQLGNIVRGENGELVWSTFEVIYSKDKDAAGESSVDKEASCNWYGDGHRSDDSNSDDNDSDDTDNKDYYNDYYDNENDGDNVNDSYDGDGNGGSWDGNHDDDDDGHDDDDKNGNHEDDNDSSDGDDKNSRDEDGGEDDENSKNGGDEDDDKSRNNDNNDDSSDNEDGDDNDDKEEDTRSHYDDESELGSKDDDDSCSNNKGDADSRDDEDGEDDDDTDEDGDARAHDDDNGDEESEGIVSEEKKLVNFSSSGDDEDVDVAGNSLDSNDNGDDSDSHGGTSSVNNDSSDCEYSSDDDDENDEVKPVSAADDVHLVTSPLKKHEAQQVCVYNPFEPRSPPNYNAQRPLIRLPRAKNHVFRRLPSPTSPSDRSDQGSISSYPNEPQYTENAHASSPSSRLHGPTSPSHNEGGSFAPTYAQFNHPEGPTSRRHEIQGHAIHPVHVHHQNQNPIPSQLSHYVHERSTTGSEHAWQFPYMPPQQHPDVPFPFYGLGGSNTDIMTGNTGEILDALNADTNGTSQCEGFLRAAESDLQHTCNIGPSERRSPSTHPSSPRTARLSLEILSPRVRLNDKSANSKRKSPPQL